MSSVTGGYSTTATTYGRLPADAYYQLTAPGVINGDTEITGNLKVDGTAEFVGAVTMDSSLSAGAISCTTLTTTAGISQSSAAGVSTFAGAVGFTGAVNLGPNFQFTGTVGATTYGTPAAPIQTTGATTCSQSVGVIRMTKATNNSLGALIPLDNTLFSDLNTIVMCSPVRFSAVTAVGSFAGIVITGGSTGFQLELIMLTGTTVGAGDYVDMSFSLINSL
jgi:hypothetical protein